MTFLKNLGLNIVKGISKAIPFLSIIDAVAPGAAPVVDKIGSELSQFAAVVTTVEAAGASFAQPMPGADKMQLAIPLIGKAVAQSELLVGKTIANQTLYDKAVQEYAQATVDLLNSLQAPAA